MVPFAPLGALSREGELVVARLGYVRLKQIARLTDAFTQSWARGYRFAAKIYLRRSFSTPRASGSAPVPFAAC